MPSPIHTHTQIQGEADTFIYTDREKQTRLSIYTYLGMSRHVHPHSLKQQADPIIISSCIMSNLKQYLPVPTLKQRYYTLEEVSQHNTANDCWVILFGEVYDLTHLVQSNIEKKESRPIINAAGSDITYWFDWGTREPRRRVEVETGVSDFYCPCGEFLQLRVSNEIKWWKDTQNIIGKLTKKSRKIKIINMLTDHCSLLEVPSEETISEILVRYKRHNKHGGSYTWKRLGRPLDMQQTLGENGIEDEDPEFDRLGIIKSDWYVPTIHLFFNDDLTVA